MLVLSRRPGQGLRIGASVEVQIVRLEGDRVVLGIVAPRYVAVVRSELLEEVSTEVKEAADTRAQLRVMLKPRPAGIGAVPGYPPDAFDSVLLDRPDGDGPEIA